MWSAELFGTVSFFLHLAAYGMYAVQVLGERVKPNVAAWLMWVFGGVVEWQTYDHMTNSHWSSSLLPLACVIGLGFITTAIVVTYWRNRGTGRETYHRPKFQDWAFVSFDVAAGALWWVWDMPEEANALAVATTIVTFIPIWRTTWHEPQGENPWMWLTWCWAYMFMLGAVIMNGGDNLLWQGFYPVYYLVLHLVVAMICLRTVARQNVMPAE
jgi:hypothetical protein